MSDVRMPDGTIIRNVPAGTTRAQLEAKWRASQPQPRVRSTGSGVMDGLLSTINETLIGGVQGVENMGRVVTDPIVGAIWGKQGLQADRRRSQQRYDAASRALSPHEQPIARTAGQIASAAIFGRVQAPTALGRVAPVATRATQGAIGGAAVRDTNADAGESMGVGAATNVVLPPLLARAAGTRPARWLGNKLLGAGGKVADDVADAGRRLLGINNPARLPRGPAPVNPLGGFLPPAIPARAAPSVAPQAARLSPMGRLAQARAARLHASGVTRPTTGMVTRNPRAWTAEREAAKVPGVGDDLNQAYTETNQQLAARGREIVEGRGGAIGSEATGQRLADALAQKNQALSDEVGALYQGVRDTVGDVRVPTLESLKSAQAHPDWADNTEFDNMVAALNKRLLRYADADGGAAGLTVNQSEELRKFIGGLGPNTSQGYAMRRALQDGLDADVLDNIGGAPFANARAAARARFEEFKGTFPGKVADEGIAPERLAARVSGAPLSDVRALQQSLLTGSPGQVETGQQAWQALQAQTADDLLGRYIRSDGDNVTINAQSLVNGFESKADHLRTILGPEAYKDLRRLVYASRDAVSPPAGSSVNYSNTASVAGADVGRLFPEVQQPRALGPAAKTVIRGTGAIVGGALGSAGGPIGTGASAVGGIATAQGLERTLTNRAQQQYLDRLAEQTRLARDPYAAADSLALPSVDEAIRQLRLRWENLSGNSPVLGGLAASTQKR